MLLGMEVGLGPGDVVFDGDPAPPGKNAQPPTQFVVHVYCGQTAGWIKMPLGTEINLGPGDGKTWRLVPSTGRTVLQTVAQKCHPLPQKPPVWTFR